VEEGQKVKKSGVISADSQITANVTFMLKTIAAVATFTYGYVTIKNSITELENDQIRIQNEVEMNSEFRVKWPRGELGALPDDAEQNMRLVHIEKTLDKIDSHIDELRFDRPNLSPK
jgi:hypothetical protein